MTASHRTPRLLRIGVPKDRVRSGRPIALRAALASSILLAGCSEAEAPHPWLDLTGAPPHRIVEVGGASAGQLVIVMDPEVTYEEVLDLGRRIADQAPAGGTVNARIFNDEGTARSWRTAPGAWTVQHLLAVVTAVPETGRVEVRWVGPLDRLPEELLLEALEARGGPSAPSEPEP